MRAIMLGIIVLAIAAILSACASAPQSQSSAPSADQVAMMTLSQRAALVKQQDPINRVEVMLGEPVLSVSYTNDKEMRMLESYYAISHDNVLAVRYISAMNFFHSLVRNGHYDRFPSLLSKDQRRYEALREEAMRNGYPDWTVVAITLVKRGQKHPEAIFSPGAFACMDEGTKETFDYDEILATPVPEYVPLKLEWGSPDTVKFGDTVFPRN